MTQFLGITLDQLGTLANVATTLIAVCALFSTLWAALIQRQHNKLSVRPIPQIELRDMNNHILINLCNNGAGPLIINKFTVKDKNKTLGNSLIECLPKEQIYWTFFVACIDGRSIRPNDQITLIELEYEYSDKKQLALADLVRWRLAELTIEIEYENVYQDTMPTYTKTLEWFKRLLT